jgi:hypothetical protein
MKSVTPLRLVSQPRRGVRPPRAGSASRSRGVCVGEDHDAHRLIVPAHRKLHRIHRPARRMVHGAVQRIGIPARTASTTGALSLRFQLANATASCPGRPRSPHSSGGGAWCRRNANQRTTRAGAAVRAFLRTSSTAIWRASNGAATSGAIAAPPRWLQRWPTLVLIKRVVGPGGRKGLPIPSIDPSLIGWPLSGYWP